MAYLVEQISGLTYQDFLSENFFKPLGMTRSGVLPFVHPNLVSGHRISPTTPVETNSNDYSRMIGSGSNYSNVYDLLKWSRAIAHGKIVDMWKLSYPYGWGQKRLKGFNGKKATTVVHQSGLIGGYSAYTSIFPKDNLYIIFLTNISSGFFNVAQDDIRNICLVKPIANLRKIIPDLLSEDEMVEYTGNYETADKFPFKIKLEDKALYIVWGEGEFDDVLLSPISTDIFLKQERFHNEFISSK